MQCTLIAPRTYRTTAFARHKRLLDLVIEHLCQNLFEAARLPNLAALSRLCQITVLLYARLRRHLLLQLEALVAFALLPVAEGKGRQVDADMQEAALEVLDAVLCLSNDGQCH